MIEKLRKIGVCFIAFILFFTPLIFFTHTSEVFELNKMVFVYIGTVCAASTWFLRMVLKKEILFTRTPWDIPLVLFLTVLAFASSYSIDPHTSFFGYYGRFNGGLIPTLTFALLYWTTVNTVTRKEVTKLIHVILYASILISLWGILEHYGLSPSCIILRGEWTATCWDQELSTRVFATFGQPNWMAAWLASVSPLAWHRFFTAKSRQEMYIWSGSSFLFFAALLATRSRSGILGIVVALMLYCLLGPVKKTLRRKQLQHLALFVSSFVLPLLIFGSTITPGINDLLPEKQKIAYEVQKESLTEGFLVTSSTDIRKIVWRGALDLWKRYPFLGTGPETFALAYPETRPAVHNLTSEWNFIYNKAHNEYLNYAATTGTLGILTYLIIVTWTLKMLLKNERIELLAGYGALLVTSFFGFSVVSTSLLFFLFPAFALAQVKKHTTHRQISLIQKAQIGGICTLTLLLLWEIATFWYADTLYARGKTEYAQGRYDRAVTELTTAIALSPYEPRYLAERASVYSDVAIGLSQEDDPLYRDFLAHALEDSQKSVLLSPRNIQILKSRSTMFTDLTYIDEAYLEDVIRVLEVITSHAPTDATAHYNLAVAYYRSGNIQMAIELLEETVDMKSNYEDAYRLLNILKEKEVE